MTWEWMKKTIKAVAAVAALSWWIEASNVSNNKIADYQNKIQKLSMNILWETNSTKILSAKQLAQLWINSLSDRMVSYNLDKNETSDDSGDIETDDGYVYIFDWKRVQGTLVAGPAMYVDKTSSSIWLNYLEITNWDKQLANMLADGEKEFFSNIDKVVAYKGWRKRYKRRSRQEAVWTEIVKTIWKWEMDKRQLNTLKIGSPNMILSFVELDNKNFSLLKEIWKLEVEEWKLEVEEWKLEVEEWKLEVEEWKLKKLKLLFWK